MAPPVISADGSIYFTSHNGMVYALNADGTQKWSYNLHGSRQTISGPVISPSGHLYVQLDAGSVFEF